MLRHNQETEAETLAPTPVTISTEHVAGSTQSMTTRSGVRNSGGWFPGLDGVRGIAVGLVFTVHYIGKYPIGWMGVIFFFVLSGYLITGGLYDTRDEPHRFRRFYIRRTLRIFPLFYFVWISILVADPLIHERWQPMQWLWPVYLGNFARFIAYSPSTDHIYTSVLWLPIEIGHFWSLAVEEQFYLVWPFVVFSIADRKKLIRICVGVMVAVLLLRIILVAAIPSGLLQMEFLYRMPFTQADSFLCGGLLALWWRGPERERMLRAAPYLFFAFLGIFVFACSIEGAGVGLNKLVPATPWISGYGFTLIYLIAAALIASSLSSTNLLFKITNLRPLRFLGKYSYGFYVYHVILRPILIKPWGELHSHWAFRLSVCIEFAIVLAVSVVSYHLLEAPFLRLKGRLAGHA